MIPIDEHELNTNHMTKQCNNFMERVEDKIGNTKQSLFSDADSDKIYYSTFGYTDDADNNALTYGDDIQDQKEVEVNEAYIGALENYIGAKVVVIGKDSIPYLSRVKHRKRNFSGNPICEEHNYLILDTRVYDL